MNKWNKILMGVLIAALCAVCFWGGMNMNANQGSDNYTLYIGTNDKDTGAPVRSYEKSKELVGEVCQKYLEGYTLSDAKGYWVGDDGKPCSEETIVCYVSGIDDASVQKLAKEIGQELNQNSVMVTKSQVQTSFVESAESAK